MSQRRPQGRSLTLFSVSFIIELDLPNYTFADLCVLFMG